MTLAIVTLTDSEFDLDAFKALFQEYLDAIQSEFPFEDFETERHTLPGPYHPTCGGQLFLALWHNTPAGCAAIHQLAPDLCELKRLYVKPQYQGLKIGSALVDQAILEARHFGYRKLYLDSLRQMTAAQALYHKRGFYEIPPYNDNPHPDVYHMALDLAPVTTP